MFQFLLTLFDDAVEESCSHTLPSIFPNAPAHPNLLCTNLMVGVTSSESEVPPMTVQLARNLQVKDLAEVIAESPIFPQDRNR